MDSRRNSGSYAGPSSQYYGYEQYSHQQPPSTHSGRAAAHTAFHVPKTRQSNSNQLQNSSISYSRPDGRNITPSQGNFSGSLGQPTRRRSNHGSVSHRSPLQKLEGQLDDISKEERRSRYESTEHHAVRTAVPNQSRRVRTGSQQLTHDTHDPTYPHNERRHSSAPLSAPAASWSIDHNGRRPSLDHGGQSMQSNDTCATDASQKFRRASDALRMQAHSSAVGNNSLPSDNIENVGYTRQQERSLSKNYRHRARDAGFAGAAAAAAAIPPASRTSYVEGIDGRNGSNDRRRLSTDRYASIEAANHRNHQPLERDVGTQKNRSGDMERDRTLAAAKQMQSGYADNAHDIRSSRPPQGRLDMAHSSTKTDRTKGSAYNIPPQTFAGKDARDYVGFANVQPVHHSPDTRNKEDHHHGIRNFFHRQQQADGTFRKKPELQEFRQAGVVRLTLDEMDIQDLAGAEPQLDDRGPRRTSRSTIPSAYDGAYDEPAKTFRPPLYLTCGPLLRYTGMRTERLSQPNRTGLTQREFWRGSVMIVTQDEHSSYEETPNLRLFAQPMDLLPILPPDRQQNPPAEHLDPILGQMKVSRTGKPLYVRPVDVLEDGIDVSSVENESGLFELKPSTRRGPACVDGISSQARQDAREHGKTRVKSRDGEKSGRYREAKAARLHRERGVTFWRFNLEIELGSSQARVAYRINRGPAIGFWVPGRGQSMNIMFHSCNGFSLSVNPDDFTGPDPLWRNVLNKHQSKPFHVMLGGGDQIYNDAAMRDTTHFKEWLQIKNPEHKHRADFTEEMQDELETFYLNRYSMWFSQGMFGMANSQIPMVNIWDDHDIIDGYGSYPHHFMSTKVFTGLGAVAFKYYMLFQHQSVVCETQREEPSWVLGASPGPYINELSRSVFMFLGRKIAFLGLDCRTERMRNEVLSQQSYDLVFDRCRSEIVKGDTKHLIVLLGVPIAYPRLNFLENILTSRVMDPIKAIGRTGVLGGFVNKFDGGVEILDDLDDHWTAKHHKPERNWFIQELQQLAAEKSIRVTILGGDVHLGAVGQFYTKRKIGVPKDRDHRYMPNVISSAIVNTPPPNIMGDVLNKRNKVHHLDAETDEDMIPMFEQDVNGKARNNLHLLPRRNFCSIREYTPGSTPPPSPNLPSDPEHIRTDAHDDLSDHRQYPPGSMVKSVSDGRRAFRPGALVRRLSGSSAKERQLPAGKSCSSENPQLTDPFRRIPTNYSDKAALKASAKGGPESNIEGSESGHVNLEGGLDICLNMEVDQKSPAGTTMPYRLLVPALWYQGGPDINKARFKSRGASMIDHLRGRSIHAPPSLGDGPLRSHGDRSSSESSEGWSSNRLDDKALGSRLGANKHGSQQFLGARSHPYARGGPSKVDTVDLNHTTGPIPSIPHHHVDSTRTDGYTPFRVETQHQTESRAHNDLESAGRKRRTWKVFGRRQRPTTKDSHDQEVYDDCIETESSVSGLDSDGEYDHQQERAKSGMVSRMFGRRDAREHNYRPQVEKKATEQAETTDRPGWRIWK